MAITHRFLAGLTFFHAVGIAAAAPFLSQHWELSLWAFFDDDSMLHIVGEGLVVASFGALAYHPLGVDAIVGKPVTLDALTDAIRKATAKVAAPR